MPSEKLYGISPQPEETCPLIDDVIKEIDNILDHTKRHEKMEESGLRDAIERIETDLSNLIHKKYQIPNNLGGYDIDINPLEKIRKRVTEVRSWGQEWKELAKKYSNEINDLENTIKEYKEEIREHKREIDYLKANQEELHKQIDKAANSY
jgi:chromosome segregation ATPase